MPGACLAFDVGQRRVGMAVGGGSVPPIGRGTLDPDDSTWPQTVAEIIEAFDVEQFVVGLPVVKRPQASASVKLARDWGRRLEISFPDIPIAWVDESYTSREAERQLIGAGINPAVFKAAVDERSAILILDQFLGDQG